MGVLFFPLLLLSLMHLEQTKPDTLNSVKVAHYKWNYSMISWSIL